MKKGFTLIELLAVIIILSVIALITVPTIINVVDNSKEKSRISSVNNLIDATRLYMNEAMLDSSIDLSGNLLETINNRVKGTKPSEGEIIIEDNNIGIAVKIDGYCYIKDYSESEIRKTNDENCVIYKEITATCYGETDVVDGFEINYNNCVATLPIMLQSYNVTLSDEEVSSVCKNEMKVAGVLNKPVYFKDGVMATYLSNDPLYDSLISANMIEVKTKKGCKTCFEYSSGIDYDINYEGCVGEFAIEDICNGKKTDNSEKIIKYIQNGLIENVVFDDNSNTSHIIDYLCYEDNDYGLPVITSLTTPTLINDLKVIGIAPRAFRNKNLASINISHGVKSLGYSAFFNNQLTSVKLPNSLTTIGSDAFSSNQLTSVKLPNSVTTIGFDAFSFNLLSGELDLSNLTNLTTIGYDAFRNNQLTSVKLPNNVTTIGSDAFKNNPNLTLIEIDNIKDTISGSPWGSNATVTWLRNSD